MSWVEWPPAGFPLPDGTRRGRVLAGAEAWQIVMTSAEAPALLVSSTLHARWGEAGLIGGNLFVPIEGTPLLVLMGKRGYLISSIQHGPYPTTSTEARAFAMALREARKAVGDIPLHDALYLEQFSLLLPTYTPMEPFDDATVLGAWLSAGVRISATSLRRLCKLLSWMSPQEVQAIVREAGFLSDSDKMLEGAKGERADTALVRRGRPMEGRFSLPGRPELEAFFNEHILEIVRDEEKYLRMGIGFPSAVVLYGPPGCGKTFAVERLIEFLDWPRYTIDSGSIGSPYIHDTSRKTAELFEEAMRNAPSVVVIDEMEAFLSDRMTQNAGAHHVEEVAEFLRRIPEASRGRVLVIAMTNRIEAIDPAVLRRGRFDHVIEVKMPSAGEVKALLSSLFAGLPLAEGVDLGRLAEALAGKPLSDAAFVVKEAGRVSAREGRDVIDAEAVRAACDALSQRSGAARKVGF